MQPRQFVVTTEAHHRLAVALNLARRLRLSGMNQLWVADITYIRLKKEFAYLAVVLDVYSRKVVGWKLSRSLGSGLAQAALEAAIQERQPPPGLVHHSDRGVQYACREYVALLERQQVIASMSRPGNPYDNANCESFIRTLKREEIDAYSYQDLEQLRDHVGEFIEQYYNRQRLYSALGYRSPEEFEQQAVKTTGAGEVAAATMEFSLASARATTRLLGNGDSNAVPFPSPQPPAGDCS